MFCLVVCETYSSVGEIYLSQYFYLLTMLSTLISYYLFCSIVTLAFISSSILISYESTLLNALYPSSFYYFFIYFSFIASFSNSFDYKLSLNNFFFYCCCCFIYSNACCYSYNDGLRLDSLSYFIQISLVDVGKYISSISARLTLHYCIFKSISSIFKSKCSFPSNFKLFPFFNYKGISSFDNLNTCPSCANFSV